MLKLYKFVDDGKKSSIRSFDGRISYVITSDKLFLVNVASFFCDKTKFQERAERIVLAKKKCNVIFVHFSTLINMNQSQHGRTYE